MIRYFLLGLFLCFCSCGVVCAGISAPLRIHAWVDYFPSWLLDAFTEETGIPVVQTFLADDKVLYRNLTAADAITRYDVITPSSSMLQQLAQENRLLPLDKGSIPNRGEIESGFWELDHDLGGKYSVPLFWGVLGIVVMCEVVPEAVAQRIEGFKDLWMPELKGMLLLPNNFRSLMSMMLLTLGYSVNDPSPEHLKEAMKTLEELAPSVRIFDSVDQDEYMSRLGIGVAVVWEKRFYGK